jgi:hypothetical protein
LDAQANGVFAAILTLFVTAADRSAPELAARRLKAGERLHVWGIPRVDFAEISRRAAAAPTHPAALQQQPLPYEIIVIGLFEDKKPAALPLSGAPGNRHTSDSPRAVVSTARILRHPVGACDHMVLNLDVPHRAS